MSGEDVNEDDVHRSIADLVEKDYDGSEECDRATVLATLAAWRRNNKSARVLIDALGDQAVIHYEIAWRDAHAAEYDLDGEEE